MRRIRLVSAVSSGVLLATASAAFGLSSAGASPAADMAATPARAASTQQDYLVLYSSPAAAASARAAIKAAGGSLLKENRRVGYALVRTSRTSFATTVTRSTAVDGTARNRVIGVAPRTVRARTDDVERLPREREAVRGTGGQADAPTARRSKAAAVPAPEPLANRQWDMRQISATPTGSYARQPGKRTVLVGVIDTGIDGSHPDVAPNFDDADSHNFVTDNPAIDGPCEVASCVDPANVDDGGHGTHVASTIASPLNGLGIAGVAPNVRVANLRAGQDSGFFFLQPTLEAITYAGDIGADVINMSFFIDPWLFNCVDNPADSQAERTEQRVVRQATQRALNYARRHGVLPVSSLGNEFMNLNAPTTDTTSPDFPAGAERTRTIDNSCITVPTESRGVMSVAATGPSTRMAFYSNYGTEQNDVSAPGGDFWDSPDNTGDPRNLVLAAYPERLARANGDLNADGTPNTPFVVRDCKGSVCGYYQYAQGTSMASPHAAGVAALVVSQFGVADRRHPGLTLAPTRTQRIVQRTAVDHPCPQPRTFTWTRVLANGQVATQSATCTGGTGDNGFYGNGIVNAFTAVAGAR
ncbi:MAG TPA: S8 family serine peptidase [Actinomycetales bacterium]|nr:S8 family serine peptidase [Actinomycetales bacterium]